MGILQDAQDAKFTYDGISMSRSTNTITDISYGTTINLLKDSGSANISITQDRAQIATEMEGMVNNYNTLIKQIGDMTAYDATAGKVGIFNGDNTIKNISREITKMITSYNTSGYSLPQYGISLDKTGVMSFDKATFTAKLDADPTGTEAFFSGKTAITSVGTTKTGSLTATTSLISSGASGTLSIQVAGVGHNFNYTNTTTLEQMRDAINADSAITSKLTASIVQYGASDFRMVLTPKGNTIGETISIGDSTTGGLVSAIKTTTTTADVATSTDGVFTSLNNLFKNYMSSTGLMTNLTNSSKAATTTLNTERTKANALLTARYDTLQAKFAAYDSLISKLNSSFSSLKQQIDAQAKAGG
jgi:flagellar hook-associated protein 2